MKQLIQEVGSGQTVVRDVPAPLAGPHEVLVAVHTSLISAGTERYVVDLAKKSLLAKARSRPDHVRRVLDKLRTEGFAQTFTQVKAKLDEPMPLGYSAAGVVIECGSAVDEFKPGDRVAVAAPHAGIVAVGKNLCARIPEGLTFEQAAYASVAAIALQGVRLAKVTLGERVSVIGLGLVGQLVAGFLKGQGCRVFGTDIDAGRLALGRIFGCDEVAVGSPRDAVLRFAGQYGVDAVVITAATASNDPIEFAADICRPKGRIVLVGVVGLNLPRAPFYKKELEFTVSSSLGPGRGDATYETKGVDYPIGYARWTAQRNMEAALELVARGDLPVERLTTHRFSIDQAPDAYAMITDNTDSYMGILLGYPAEPVLTRRIEIRSAGVVKPGIGVSVVGIGNYARLTMLPELLRLENINFRGLVSAKGMTAVHHGEKAGFAFATSDADEVLRDPATDALFIVTRHDLHADLVVRALRAGKHVFVEKPLCIDLEQLESIRKCVEELGEMCPVLTVGFNRRFASATAQAIEFFDRTEPITVSYRFAPGHIPRESWVQDPDVGGGRIIGEACHAIDTATAIIGAEPVEVFARSVDKVGGIETADDQCFITLRHANGGVSSISYQAGGDKALPSERIEVFGGGRVAIIDAWKSVELWHKGKPKKSTRSQDKGHAAEFRAFLDGIRTGRWPIAWRDLYSVSWASIAAVSSLRDGVNHTLDR